jgi:tripartite-type tricarboxylate transporter receptor subunit TctC
MAPSSRRTFCVTAAAVAIGVAWAEAACAAFPEKPVRLIVPFAPGGGTDLVARSLAAGLATEFGQPVIVENKPGGGTIIGSDVVANSPKDGYTLLVATFAHAVNPSLQPKWPYDTDKAFAAVTMLARSHNILVVRPDSPHRTVQDILSAARAAPDKLNYASQGNGTSAHLAGELFTNLAGVRLTHVPYRGAGPALTDLLGGQVDMMFATSAAAAAFLSTKRLRAIATTAPAGLAGVDGAPPLADAVPGYVVDSWYGLYAPAGTAAEVIVRINQAARKAMKTADFEKRAKDEGLLISASTPEEQDAFVRKEAERWRKVVRENKITAG